MKTRRFTTIIPLILFASSVLVGCGTTRSAEVGGGVASGPNLQGASGHTVGPGRGGGGVKSEGIPEGSSTVTQHLVLPEGSGALEPAPDLDQQQDAEGTVLDRIHFAFDDYTLTQEARDTLIDNAQHISENRGTDIVIQGHCDERGTTDYNLALGEKRALSAYQYLQDLGVEPRRMVTVSYGEERPFDGGRSEQAWALNRRAEFLEMAR